MCTAGFLYRKRTSMVMYLTFGTALINIVLNVVLLPIMGLSGAAAATLVSHLLYATSGIICSGAILGFRVPWLSVAKYAVYAGIMFGCLLLCPVKTGALITTVLATALSAVVALLLVTIWMPFVAVLNSRATVSSIQQVEDYRRAEAELEEETQETE